MAWGRGGGVEVLKINNAMQTSHYAKKNRTHIKKNIDLLGTIFMVEGYF